MIIQKIQRFLVNLCRKKEPIDPSEVKRQFIREMQGLSQFRETRFTEQPPTGKSIILTHIIYVPPAFHYCNLDNQNSDKAKQWRTRLRKHCCQRTRVQWCYVADGNKLKIEGIVKEGSENYEVTLKHMHAAIECLREWLKSECERQDIKLGNPTVDNVMTAVTKGN